MNDSTQAARDNQIIALLQMRQKLKQQQHASFVGIVTLKREFYGAVDIDADLWQGLLLDQLRRVEASLAELGVRP